jgi:hypothetical protein
MTSARRSTAETPGQSLSEPSTHGSTLVAVDISATTSMSCAGINAVVSTCLRRGSGGSCQDYAPQPPSHASYESLGYCHYLLDARSSTHGPKAGVSEPWPPDPTAGRASVHLG